MTRVAGDYTAIIPHVQSATCEISETPPHAVSAEPGRRGIAQGLNVQCGSIEEGWTVPPPVTLSDGSTVQLYKDGQALRAVYDAIQSARQSILLETYTIAGDATGRAFMDLLAAKARQGVRVHMIYDSFGSRETPKPLFRQLKAVGVHVQEFHPFAPWRCNFSWRPFNRDHRKLVIVDGGMAALGGLNIADDYAGPWVAGYAQTADDPWRDSGICLRGPAVALLHAAFITTWLYVTRGGRFNRALHAYNLDGQKGPIRLLASVPTMDSPLADLLNRLLSQAKESIDLTSAYFAPAGDFVQKLCLAAGRGVRVRLMLPSRTDAPIMLTAARSFYAQLLASGIMIYERQSVKLHAKSLVVDGQSSLVGSTNLDYRSVQYNCELAAVIQSREFGQQMTDLFEHDIAYSRRINANAWRRRHTMDRIMQWAVNRSRHLL